MTAAKKLHTALESETETVPESLEVPKAQILEELASRGGPMEYAEPSREVDAAESWMQTFLDAGVRPPLDVVRVYMAEYRRMWARLNKGKEWSDRQAKTDADASHWRFVSSAVLAVQACSNSPEINFKTYEAARSLLLHFGIPSCENITAGAVEKIWKRHGHSVRPDDDLIGIFVYAQRRGMIGRG